VVSIIDFAPLWETMKQKQVSQYQILKRGIDNKTLDSLKKNKNITLTTLEKLCKILECTPNEIVMFHD
jgi:Predicted transcriptional regulator